MLNEAVCENVRIPTIKEKVDRLTDCVNENGKLIQDLNKFLFNDERVVKKDSASVASLESAIASLCDEAYTQRDLLYGIMNRLGVNPSDNMCAR